MRRTVVRARPLTEREEREAEREHAVSDRLCEFCERTIVSPDHRATCAAALEAQRKGLV